MKIFYKAAMHAADEESKPATIAVTMCKAHGQHNAYDHRMHF
jgi:hypothetical protein